MEKVKKGGEGEEKWVRQRNRKEETEKRRRSKKEMQE